MTSKLGREMHALDTAELERRLVEAQNDLIGIRFGLATRQTENTARIVHAKRQIARIKTILTERQQEA
jgi:large subunit ribosomal protein L29